ncbi:hypothetical protein BGY98DRAFT_71367 [Russula aff. rugulosa BPL654]|nr:hypothetical protein BGY98DRAFT_71367 [Russula aff. rugulosa BPL654]
MKIQYSINDGLKMDFFVPGLRETMRLAAYSCNGFSAGVDPDSFRGPGSRLATTLFGSTCWQNMPSSPSICWLVVAINFIVMQLPGNPNYRDG